MGNNGVTVFLSTLIAINLVLAFKQHREINKMKRMIIATILGQFELLDLNSIEDVEKIARETNGTD